MPNPGPTASSEVDTTRVIMLTDKDVRDAARLLRLISARAPWADLVTTRDEVARFPGGEASSRDELLDRARAMLHARRLRAQHFGRVMSAEPAWDMLLFLYVCRPSEGRQTLSSLAELVETPLTTALRWIAYLEKEGLVTRKDHPTDRRIVFIELNDKGLKAMDAFLANLPGLAP